MRPYEGFVGFSRTCRRAQQTAKNARNSEGARPARFCGGISRSLWTRSRGCSPLHIHSYLILGVFTMQKVGKVGIAPSKQKLHNIRADSMKEDTLLCSSISNTHLAPGYLGTCPHIWCSASPFSCRPSMAPSASVFVLLY